MCDFRKINTVIIDGEKISVEYKEHFSWWDMIEYPIDPGIYYIGASGVGQYYYDGTHWYSDYNYSFGPLSKCEFKVV